jgi:hypothetical protein
MIATLAAAATLLVGYPITEDPHSASTPVGSAAFLSPTTLQPRADSPQIDAPAIFATAPDRSLTVAGHVGSTLHIYAGAEEQRTVEIPDRPGAVLLAWPKRSRLLVFSCAGFPAYNDRCDTTDLRVIDPRDGRIVRDRELPGPTTDVSVAKRRVLVMHRGIATGPEVGGDVRILDADGRTRHKVDVAGALSGTIVSPEAASSGSAGTPGKVTRIDPVTGRTRVRAFEHEPALVLPRPPGAVIVRIGNSNRYLVLDPRTLRTMRSFRAGMFNVEGTPHGYLVRDDRLKAYSVRGKRLWSVPVQYADYGAIGSYVYVQRGLDTQEDPNYRVDVYAARSGEHVATVPGRFILTSPTWEQHASFGPLVDGSTLAYDDD